MKNLIQYINDSSKIEINEARKAKVSTFFKNLDIYKDFRHYDLGDGLPRLVNKIFKYFNSKGYETEWINEYGDKDCFNRGRGWFGFTAKLILKKDNKEYEMKVNWRDNYHHTKAKISVNDEEIFNLDYTTTNWDAGCYTNNHSIKLSDKIDTIFN